MPLDLGGKRQNNKSRGRLRESNLQRGFLRPETPTPNARVNPPSIKLGRPLTMRNRSLLALALIAGAFATSCVRKIQSTVPAFAQAMTVTATNVQGAFDIVESTYYDTEVLNFAVNYSEGITTDPSKLGGRILPPETLAVRVLVLEGLKQYASQLSSLTAANQEVDDATRELSNQLKALGGTPPFQKINTDANFDANVAGAAINAFANWLIDRKLKKHLPEAIEKMDPTIQSISRLLIADIGSVNTDPEHPSRGSGLRQLLWVQYGREIMAWDEFVRKNYLRDNVSPEAKLTAIKEIAALAHRQKAADRALAQVTVTIKQMAQAHAELVRAAKTKQRLTTDLGDLVAEAKRLDTYCNSLTSSK
jgi:hypothetical protein